MWAYLSSLGGGLVAGDQTRLWVEVGEQARCFLTTQASTKVYRNPAERPCSHTTEVSLGTGSVLVLASDPVQAYAGASYSQRQQLHVHPESSLVLLDWLSCGRHARGERWAFNRFESRLEIFSGAQRVLLDSLSLDVADGPVAERLGRFNCLAAVLLLGPELREAAARALAEAGAQPVSRRASLIYSVNPVWGGVLVRIAGQDMEEVARDVHRRLAFVPELLGDDPWARKW